MCGGTCSLKRIIFDIAPLTAWSLLRYTVIMIRTLPETYLLRVTKLLALIGLLFALAGCALLPDQIDKTKNWSAERLYSEAKDALDSGDYTTAIKYFETLEARYPFGRYAQQAQLEVIYAYYKDQEPAPAISAADPPARSIGSVTSRQSWLGLIPVSESVRHTVSSRSGASSSGPERLTWTSRSLPSPLPCHAAS